METYDVVWLEAYNDVADILFSETPSTSCSRPRKSSPAQELVEASKNGVELSVCENETALDDEAQESTGHLQSIAPHINEHNPNTTKKFITHVTKHMSNARVFLVIGRPGTWKLSFLEEVVGELVGTYKCPKSGTLTHGIWPTIIDEKQYLFVEIPEFGAADTTDVDSLKNAASCVRAFSKFTKITGVLFLHDCNEDWMSKQGLQAIRWLQCFCGPKFYDRITIITSRGDNRDLEQNTVASTKGDRLKEEYFVPLICPPAPLPGARTLYHAFADYVRTKEDLEPLSEHEFQYNKRSDWIRTSIARIYDDDPDIELPDIELQVTTEMKRGVRLLDTEAERTLSLKPYHTIIRANDRWAIVYKNGIDYSIEDWASSYARYLEIPNKVALLDATLKATAEGNANANDILEDFPYLRYWLRVLYVAALAFEQRKQDETVNMVVSVNELIDICSDMGDGLEGLVSLKLNREKNEG